MGPNLIAISARLNAHKNAHNSNAIPVNKSLNLNFISVRLKFLFFFVSLIELKGWNKMPQYLKTFILLPFYGGIAYKDCMEFLDVFIDS